MRGVIQRVSRASVTVEGEVVAAITVGYVVLVGVCTGDDDATARKLADRVAGIRLLPGPNGPIDTALGDTGAGVLVVSQFTLCADVSRGRRPSFASAARPEVAAPLVDLVVAELRERGLSVATGVFGAHMAVELVNDGPVTIVLDVPAPGAPGAAP